MLVPPKKIAVVNDISGYGRCSITTALPIISAMGLQGCPLPTAILSNHTGFPHFFFDDYTDRMPEYIHIWDKLGVSFDGILTGFLGSAQQIKIVEQFIQDFKQPSTKVIVDPIMGDHGKAYQTCTPKLCSRMKQLAAYADILVPNLTEACILADIPYQEYFSQKEISNLLLRLTALCPGRIIITGIPAGYFICNAVYEPYKETITWIRTKRAAAERCGTGDIFSAILAADVVKGEDLVKSIKKASNFVKLCLMETEQLELDKNEGVCFEPMLKKLMR